MQRGDRQEAMQCRAKKSEQSREMPKLNQCDWGQGTLTSSLAFSLTSSSSAKSLLFSAAKMATWPAEVAPSVGSRLKFCPLA